MHHALGQQKKYDSQDDEKQETSNLQSAIGSSGSRLGFLHVGVKFVHQWPRRFRTRNLAAEDLMTVYIVAAHGPVSTAFEVSIFFSPASN